MNPALLLIWNEVHACTDRRTLVLPDFALFSPVRYLAPAVKDSEDTPSALNSYPGVFACVLEAVPCLRLCWRAGGRVLRQEGRGAAAAGGVRARGAPQPRSGPPFLPTATSLPDRLGHQALRCVPHGLLHGCCLRRSRLHGPCRKQLPAPARGHEQASRAAKLCVLASGVTHCCLHAPVHPEPDSAER